MPNAYIIHGRYYGGEKFKAEVKDAISAPSAVSLAMSEVPNVRVALTSVKRGKRDESISSNRE